MMPETPYYEVLLSQSSAPFRQGNDVDIVGVTGSIPVTPTIQINNLAEVCEVPLRFNEPEMADLRPFPPYSGEDEMSEWRPIETAPKGGAEFQSWVVDDNGEGHWEHRCRFNAEHGCFELFGRVDYDMDGWEAYPYLVPTHWMPEPTPPPKEPL
jgi:hypothetical protein